MAETAKSKTRQKTSARKSTATPAAKSKISGAKKSAAASPPPDDETADTPAASSNGEHVKITPPPTPERGPGGAWFLLILLISVGAGAGYLTWPKWMPYAAAYLPEGLRISAEDTRVDGLTARIGSLENTTAALKKRDAVIEKLEAERGRLSESLSGVLSRIESLEHSIGAVKEMAKAAANATEAAQASKSLKALNERLTKMERSAPASAGGDPAMASRLARLEQDRTVANELAVRIAELEAEGAETRKTRQETIAKLTRSATALTAMDNRLRAVEGRPTGGSGKSSALVLAVSQLRDAVHRGLAYANVLDGVKTIAGTDPAMKAAMMGLENHAATGIATLSMLREEFARDAAEIAATGEDAPTEGWLARAMNSVSSLVRFRRIDGGGDAASAETLVAQAEKRLAAGDLTGAVKTIERLPATAAKSAAPWLARAKARLTAEQSLASLHVHAVSLVSAAKE